MAAPGGFELDTIALATGKQYGFAQLSGKSKGHLDGILRGGPIPMEYPVVWECKALNEKSWQAVKRNGLRLAKPLYAAQVAVNQNLTGPAVFTVLNKNTSRIDGSAQSGGARRLGRTRMRRRNDRSRNAPRQGARLRAPASRLTSLDPSAFLVSVARQSE